MNFPYVLSDEILLRSKYEKKIGQQFYVLSDCPSLYTYAYKSVFTYIYIWAMNMFIHPIVKLIDLFLYKIHMPTSDR